MAYSFIIFSFHKTYHQGKITNGIVYRNQETEYNYTKKSKVGEKKHKKFIGYNMCSWNAITSGVKAMRKVGHQNQIGNSG